MDHAGGCLECAALCADLTEWAGRLEGLARVFRATAGDRAVLQEQLYGDMAVHVRGVLAAHCPTSSAA